MRSSAILLIVAALLLGYGSVSYHWFDDSDRDLSSHQGLFASEVCGLDLGEDRLAKYERALSGHAEPAIWRCEHDLVIPLVANIHRATDLVGWLALVIGFFAGLSTSVMATVAAIRALRGRGASRRAAIAIATTPVVGVVSPLVLFLTDDMAGARLDYAAGLYAAGTVLAVIAAVRIRRM